MTDRVRHLPPRSLSASSFLRLLVRLYQCTFGIVLPNSCRYQPTCSHYALAALTEHGAVRGTWLTLKRILRCHPFARGGYDPVPTKGLRTKDKGQSPDFATERRTTTG
ncbi:MAG: membrane protein insertion efficiency factor YidD [candidate division WOR-3 bacterium]|nr:membrane protein insertion efficiency factor YidD [candidate division WOR-3 bacterium]